MSRSRFCSTPPPAPSVPAPPRHALAFAAHKDVLPTAQLRAAQRHRRGISINEVDQPKDHWCVVWCGLAAGRGWAGRGRLGGTRGPGGFQEPLAGTHT